MSPSHRIDSFCCATLAETGEGPAQSPPRSKWLCQLSWSNNGSTRISGGHHLLKPLGDVYFHFSVSIALMFKPCYFALLRIRRPSDASMKWRFFLWKPRQEEPLYLRRILRKSLHVGPSNSCHQNSIFLNPYAPKIFAIVVFDVPAADDSGCSAMLTRRPEN